MQSFRDAPAPLENHTAVRLVHTHRRPAEWIGSLKNGDRIHMVADARALKVAIAGSLGEALRRAKDGDVEVVKHKSFNSEVSTADMLKVTGLKLSCEVLKNCQGETR